MVEYKNIACVFVLNPKVKNIWRVDFQNVNKYLNP